MNENYAKHCNIVCSACKTGGTPLTFRQSGTGSFTEDDGKRYKNQYLLHLPKSWLRHTITQALNKFKGYK